MKEFKHSCTRALHLTSCDFPARGPSVSHPKPLPAPGDPAGGGNVRAGAGRAAPSRHCPALPRRGAECRGANGGGARQCARQDGPCRPDSKKHNPCSLSPETNTNLECFTAHHYEIREVYNPSLGLPGGTRPGHCPPGRTPRALLLSLRTQEPDTGTGRTGPWIFCGGSPSGACSTPRKAPVWAHEASPFAPEA